MTDGRAFDIYAHEESFPYIHTLSLDADRLLRQAGLTVSGSIALQLDDKFHVIGASASCKLYSKPGSPTPDIEAIFPLVQMAFAQHPHLTPTKIQRNLLSIPDKLRVRPQITFLLRDVGNLSKHYPKVTADEPVYIKT